MLAVVADEHRATLKDARPVEAKAGGQSLDDHEIRWLDAHFGCWRVVERERVGEVHRVTPSVRSAPSQRRSGMLTAPRRPCPGATGGEHRRRPSLTPRLVAPAR